MIHIWKINNCLFVLIADLSIESDCGGVAVTDFENEQVVVNLQKGLCVLNNIKVKLGNFMWDKIK